MSSPTDRANEVTQPGYWIVWSMVCIFLNVSIGGGIYGSTLCLAWVIGLWVITDLKNQGTQTGLAFLIILFVMSLTAGGLIAGTEPALRIWDLPAFETGNRTSQELGKILLLILGTMSLKNIPHRIFESLVFWIPVGIAGIVAITYISGNGNTYDPLRFNIPSMGSSNTSGYCFAISLLMAHFSWGKTTDNTIRLLIITVTLVLGAALLATVSRGAVIQYIAGLLAFTKRKGEALVGIAAIIATTVFLFPSIVENLERLSSLLDLQELQQGTGGGRIFIGKSLIESLLSAGPWHFFFGFSPGSISLRLPQGAVLYSAHSLYVEYLYSFGIIGATIGAYWMLNISRKILKSSPRDPWRNLQWGLFATMFFGGIFDSYIVAAQILWLSCVVLAILHSNSPQEYQKLRS